MSDDPLFAGFDDLFMQTSQEMPTHLPRLHEEATRRLLEAKTLQLVAELREPSSNLVFVREATKAEAMARILTNTDL
jgi:hypothetical protein